MARLQHLRQLRAKLAGWAQKSWEPVAQTSVGRFATDVYLAARALVRDFRGEDISLRAAALTYTSVFSLVPLLTVGLVLMRTLHQEEFQRHLRNAISMAMALAPGFREQTLEILEHFLTPANSIALGSVGFIALLFSASSLLRNIDGAVNEVWGIRRQRPILIRAVIYLGLLLVGPVFLAASFSGTGAVRELIVNAGYPVAPQIVLITMAGSAVMGLTLLYYWTPYAKVAVRSALAGGIVAGVGWVTAKILYQEFAEQIFRYDKLWGSLSVVPLFLAWIHVSWLLVLSGARLSYAVEHSSFRDSLWAFGNHPRALELVATRVAMEATLAWVDGQPPPLAHQLASRLRVPESFVHDAIERLVNAHLLEQSRKGGIQPARDPSDISVAEMVGALHGLTILGGPETWTGPRASSGFEQIEALFHTADCATADVLRRTRWIDLIAHLRPGLAAPETPAPPATAARG